LNIFLVRPHPPAAILSGSCPTPEAYKYNWQPTVLKYVAYQLQMTFKDDVQIKIWHLMNEDDDRNFEKALIANQPDVVIFSEIDILVGEVNKLALLVKRLLPDSYTIVGGKHTSLLQEGDMYPFKAIDYAYRGEGIQSLCQIIKALKEGIYPLDCPAVLCVDDLGKIKGKAGYEKRDDLTKIDGKLIQSFRVENHSYEEYLKKHQIHPALISGEIRTASIFAGSGCPQKCIFCQSPVEFGLESNIVNLRPPEKLAEEIAFLAKEHNVNNIFSLEANLNLENWLKTYSCLEHYGINFFPVSGFIRAVDILQAHNDGILKKLIQKGMRILSIGLDIPFESEDDIYCKAFSHSALMDCLTLCENLGIIILATFIGDPKYTLKEFQKQVEFLKGLPISSVDIRLSIALRNTKYFRLVFPWLIYKPDKNRKYFNRQNYRYQTIKIPGKITPKQTYNEVRRFYKQFLISDSHLNYVLSFIKKFPESKTYFKSQYAPVIKKFEKIPGKLYELTSLIGLSEVQNGKDC
jgi:radical SAM superfamily enzyme YgiQ (UPF0313 family)